MSKCLICNSDNCENTDVQGFLNLIKCNRGFNFIVDNDIFDMEELIQKKYINLIIEWLLRHPKKEKNIEFRFDLDNESLVISDNAINLSVLIKNYPSDITDRVNRSLLNLSSRYPIIGDQIGLDQIDSNLVFVNSKFEYLEFIGFLEILMEMGYIYNTSKASKIYSITSKGWLKIEELSKINESTKTVFIAMSFKSETNKIRESFKSAIIESGYTPVLIDEKEHNNQIVPEILYEIESSRFVVVDITYPNFGAYFEAGYAIGLKKQLIICCRKDVLESSDPLIRPHFDIAQKSQVVWVDYEDLLSRLVKRIKATIN